MFTLIEYELWPPSGDIVFSFVNDFNNFTNNLLNTFSTESYTEIISINTTDLNEFLSFIDMVLPFNYSIISWCLVSLILIRSYGTIASAIRYLLKFLPFVG